MMVGISVIIPTMNRPDSLVRTLNHMIVCDERPDQIIVVDQSQTEEQQNENREVINSLADSFPQIVYKYQKTPSSTKARNYGYSFAEHEIVVFSDDDVDVRKNTFAVLRSLFAYSSSSIAMVGGVNEGEEDMSPSTISYILGMASYRKRKKGHIARACYGRFPCITEEKTPTEWAMGFFFAVRKSLMDKWMVRFDENLLSYAYAEDLDFSYGYYLHAKKENLQCIMSRMITVKHNVSKEYRIPKRDHVFMSVLHRYYISNKFSLPLYELNNLWCNLGIMFFKLLKNERSMDMFDAQVFYYQHRKDILQGRFLNELWAK